MSKSKKHKINFGDLVFVDGYGNTPFYVDGWQDITIHEPGMIYHEKIYDVTNAHTGEYAVAYAEDLTKICDADQAEEYLRKTTGVNKGVGAVLFSFYFPDDDDDRIPNYLRKLAETPPEKPKQQRIDELLDEYNDIMRIIDEFGDDDENDYKAKLNEIERKIKAISSEKG